jgi:hypothetical protein
MTFRQERRLSVACGNYHTTGARSYRQINREPRKSQSLEAVEQLHKRESQRRLHIFGTKNLLLAQYLINSLHNSHVSMQGRRNCHEDGALRH